MRTRKRKSWKSKLTAAERKHLREMGICTLRTLQNDITQSALKGTHWNVCWTCRTIGHKLGLDVPPVRAVSTRSVLQVQAGQAQGTE